ncbi:MAG: hypothetical protein WB773_24935 [Isosphaeraceae bacterium]|jgi:hypothetical protein
MRLERAYGMGTETENLPGYQIPFPDFAETEQEWRAQRFPSRPT